MSKTFSNASIHDMEVVSDMYSSVRLQVESNTDSVPCAFIFAMLRRASCGSVTKRSLTSIGQSWCVAPTMAIPKF